MKLALSLAVMILLFSCNESAISSRSILNESNLPEQIFSVDQNRDTTLVSNAGVIIKIPAGSIDSKSNPVKLVFREALTIQQMVAAGLSTTTTSNELLSSNGMIYIDGRGDNDLEIKKSLEVLIPTTSYNPDMQVWQGKTGDNGSLQWQNPTPLPEDETNRKITNGETLFKANCASCHRIEKDFTGPALAGVTYRRPKKWLYEFTRHPAISIGGYNDSSGQDYYSHCLWNTWKPTVMTAFPALTDSDLDALYSYVKAETDKLPMPEGGYGKTCCDSCELVKGALQKIYKLNKDRDSLINDNGDFFNLDREVPVSSGNSSNPPGVARPGVETVVPIVKKATYYTINVTAMGWYNIDILLKKYSNCSPSELFVRMQGNYKLDYNVSLIIPEYKAYVEGGKLKDGVSYGFDEMNGKIPLPQGANCTVIAFAEYQGKILFGRSEFIAATKQIINVSVELMSKETMEAAIARLGIQDIKIKVDESKNSAEISVNDRMMDSLQKLLPKNCDCVGLNVPPSTETVPVRTQ